MNCCWHQRLVRTDVRDTLETTLAASANTEARDLELLQGIRNP